MERNFKTIAQKDNTTTERVKHDIDFAIKLAQKNSPHMWANYTGKTREEAILYLKNIVLCSMAN